MSSWKTYIIVACNGLAAARSQHNHQDVLLTFLAATSAMFTEVVLPHLPPEASLALAQEQVHLAVGHLQILRAQLDGAPAFEREELEDAKAIGLALAEAVPGTEASALRAVVDAADGSDVRGQHQAINDSVALLVAAVFANGEEAQRATVSRIILEHEHPCVQKDRRWLLPFGFDFGI